MFALQLAQICIFVVSTACSEAVQFNSRQNSSIKADFRIVNSKVCFGALWYLGCRFRKLSELRMLESCTKNCYLHKQKVTGGHLDWQVTVVPGQLKLPL